MKFINIFGIVLLLTIGLVSANGITLSYNDVGGEGDFTFDVVNLTINYVNGTDSGNGTTLTPEEVEDIVGGMTNGVETYITVTYDDAGGNLNYVVDKSAITSGYYNSSDNITISDVYVYNTGDTINGNLNLTGILQLEEGKNIYVETGDGLVLENLDGSSQGAIILKIKGNDTSGNELANAFWQNGKNNSFSGIGMNSVGNYPKAWVLNSTGTDINYTQLSNYVEYCAWVQDEYGLVDEGCKYFADTTARFLPLMFTGDLEVMRTATIHEGLTLFDNLDYISRGNNDANFIWSTIDSTGKVHITNQKLIEANLSFFEFSIADFDDGTLGLFTSESVSPEVGRDWQNVDHPECYSDRCGYALGGNDKIMSISSATQFQNGTIGAEDIYLSFYVTSEVGTIEVEVDDNLGNTSILYTNTGSLTDEFVNVSFPVLYENKANVTTRFSWNGLSVREVWVDEVKIQSTPASDIIINESYEGGKITLGSDSSNECYIEKVKEVNQVTQGTEGVLKIVCENVNIIGDITSSTSTIVEQNITGNSNIAGDLTVLGTSNFNEVNVGGGYGDTGSSLYSDGNIFMDGDLFIGGDILNVYDQEANGSIIPQANNTFNLGSHGYRWNDIYSNNLYGNQVYVSNNYGFFINSTTSDGYITFVDNSGGNNDGLIYYDALAGVNGKFYMWNHWVMGDDIDMSSNDILNVDEIDIDNLIVYSSHQMGFTESDHSITFYEDGGYNEFIKWNDGNDNFEISDDLNVTGNIYENGIDISSKYYLASNPSNYINDGNTNWDNSYGFVTDANLTYSETDPQVNAVTSGKWCQGTGTQVTCDVTPVTDTTYSAGNGISLSSTTFSVAGNTALTQDSDGLSVTADGIGDTQLTYNTGQHLTTTSNVEFDDVTVAQNFGAGATLNTLIDFDNASIQGNSTHLCIVGSGKLCVEI